MPWRKRGYVILVLSIVVLALFFVGCGKKKDVAEEGVYTGEVYPENGLPKDKNVTLSILFAEAGVQKSYFEYAVESFQDKFPNVTIEVKWMDGGIEAYRKLIKTIIQSDDSAAMPDWIQELPGEHAFTLAKLKKLEPQDEILERSFFDSPDLKVKEGTLADVVYFDNHNHVYSLPMLSSIYGVFFNKKLLSNYGLDIPKTWSNFMEFSSKIKAQGIYPMVMAGKYASGYFSAGWGAIPYELGGEEYIQKEYNYADDIYISRPFLEMLKRLEDYNKKGYIHPGTASFDHTQSQMELVQGKAAMITVGAWIANEMREVTPDNFEWGFMPFPGVDNEEQDLYVRVATGNGGFIWKDKPELVKKWAKEFNLWLYNLDIQKKLAVGGGMPTRKDFSKQTSNLEDISPSIAEAMINMKRSDVKVVNPSLRNPGKKDRIKDPIAIAKVSKILGDGLIQIITGRKDANSVAKDLNNQYMKGLGKK